MRKLSSENHHIKIIENSLKSEAGIDQSSKISLLGDPEDGSKIKAESKKEIKSEDNLDQSERKKEIKPDSDREEKPDSDRIEKSDSGRAKGAILLDDKSPLFKKKLSDDEYKQHYDSYCIEYDENIIAMYKESLESGVVPKIFNNFEDVAQWEEINKNYGREIFNLLLFEQLKRNISIKDDATLINMIDNQIKPSIPTDTIICILDKISIWKSRNSTVFIIDEKIKGSPLIEKKEEKVSSFNFLNNRRKEDGQTALIVALRQDNSLLVAALLRKGAAPVSEWNIPLIKAIQNKSPLTFIKKTLEKSHDIDVPINLPIDSKTAVDSGIKITSSFKEITPLNYAIFKKELDVINLLLNAKANPNLGDENATPLFFAISSKNVDIVKALLNSGADPNFSCRSQLSTTPLLHAIDSEEDLDFSCRSQPNKPPLLHAINSKAVPDFYCRSQPNKTPLLHAVDSGNVEIIKALLDAGADPYEPDQLIKLAQEKKITELDQYGKSISPKLDKKADVSKNDLVKQLGQAILTNNVDNIIDFLQNKNPDIKQILPLLRFAIEHYLNKKVELELIASLFKFKKTSLHRIIDEDKSALSIAVEHKDEKLVKVLLELGANPNMIPGMKESYEWNNFFDLQSPIFELLLVACVKKEKKHTNTNTILIDAVENHKISTNTIMLCLEATKKDSKCYFSTSDYNSHMLLQYQEIFFAAIGVTNRIDLIKKILHIHPDFINRTYNGETPLFWATKNDKLELVEFFLKEGADPNKKNIGEKTTPLSIAIELISINYKIVTALLTAKANPNEFIQYQQHSMTVINIAIIDNRTEVLKPLIEAHADFNLVTENARQRANPDTTKILDVLFIQVQKTTAPLIRRINNNDSLDNIQYFIKTASDSFQSETPDSNTLKAILERRDRKVDSEKKEIFNIAKQILQAGAIPQTDQISPLRNWGKEERDNEFLAILDQAEKRWQKKENGSSASRTSVVNSNSFFPQDNKEEIIPKKLLSIIENLNQLKLQALKNKIFKGYNEDAIKMIRNNKNEISNLMNDKNCSVTTKIFCNIALAHCLLCFSEYSDKEFSKLSNKGVEYFSLIRPTHLIIALELYLSSLELIHDNYNSLTTDLIARIAPELSLLGKIIITLEQRYGNNLQSQYDYYFIINSSNKYFPPSDQKNSAPKKPTLNNDEIKKINEKFKLILQCHLILTQSVDIKNLPSGEQNKAIESVKKICKLLGKTPPLEPKLIIDMSNVLKPEDSNQCRIL